MRLLQRCTDAITMVVVYNKDSAVPRFQRLCDRLATSACVVTIRSHCIYIDTILHQVGALAGRL